MWAITHYTYSACVTPAPWTPQLRAERHVMARKKRNRASLQMHSNQRASQRDAESRGDNRFASCGSERPPPPVTPGVRRGNALNSRQPESMEFADPVIDNRRGAQRPRPKQEKNAIAPAEAPRGGPDIPRSPRNHNWSDIIARHGRLHPRDSSSIALCVSQGRGDRGQAAGSLSRASVATRS